MRAATVLLIVSSIVLTAQEPVRTGGPPDSRPTPRLTARPDGWKAPEPAPLAAGAPARFPLLRGDPAYPGRGACRTFVFDVPAPAPETTAYLYARGTGAARDLFLRLDDVRSGFLGEDDDAGGGGAAQLEIPLRRAARLVATVLWKDEGAAGPVEVGLAIVSETAASLAAAKALEGATAAADRRRTAAPDEARRTLRAAVRRAVEEHPAATRALDAALAAAGSEAYRAGASDVARDAWRAVADYRMRVLAPAHPALSKARANLAAAHFALDERAEARRTHEESVRALEATLSDDDPGLALARAHYAAALYAYGDLAGAREQQTKSSAVLTRTVLETQPELTQSRENLSAAARAIGDLRTARAVQERILDVVARSLPEDHPDVAQARTDLAATLSALGDAASARALLGSAVDTLTRTLPADHPDLAWARLHLAHATAAAGDLSGAAALQDAALDALARAFRGDHPSLVYARIDRGTLAFQQGDLRAARALLGAAAASIARTLPAEHPEASRARTGLAAALAALGDAEGARAAYAADAAARAKSLTPEHPDAARAAVPLARAAAEAGDRAAARDLLRGAVAVFERTLSPDHPDLAGARAALVVELRATGAAAEAKRLLERTRAERLRQRARAPRDPLLAATDVALADLLRASAPADALKLERDALAIFEKTSTPAQPDVVAARIGELRSLEALGRESETPQAAAALVRGMRQATGAAGWARAHWAGADLALAAACRALRFAPPDLAAELREGALALSEARRAAETAPRPRTTELAAAPADVARAAAAGAPAKGSEEERLDALRGSVRRRAEAARRRAGVDDRAGTPAPTPQNLAATLRPGEAAATLVRYEARAAQDAPAAKDAAAPPDRYAAFVVVADDGATRFVDLGDAAEIDAAARAAAAPGADAGANAAAEATLVARIVRPLAAAAGGARRLFLDDGDLPARAPWALLAPENVEIAPVAALANVLLRRSPVRRDGQTFVAFADPAYGAAADPQADAPPPDIRRVGLDGAVFAGRAAPRFTPRAEAAAEAESAAALFKRAFPEGATHVRNGAQATRTELLRLAPTARYVHVGARAATAPAALRSWREAGRASLDVATAPRGPDPLGLSGLALAGADLPPDAWGDVAGAVSADELAAADLRRNDLWVLTDGGGLDDGARLAVLRAALHRGGARAVLAPTAPVSDAATGVFVAEFYRRLWRQKEPLVTAVAGARAALLEARDPTTNAPRFARAEAAAWTLSGPPD